MITLTIGKTVKHPVDTSRAMTNTMEISATLKESVDIKAPIFKVNFDPSNYNYISWARSDGPTRYYWIDNTVYIHNNLFEIHCSMDIMATYYTVIQRGLTGKLLYSTRESDWDQYFDDLRFSPSSLDVYDYYPIMDEDAAWMAETANVFGNDSQIWDIEYNPDGTVYRYGKGCYIVQTTSNSGPHIYIMNSNAFKHFLQNISSTFWGGIQNLGIDMTKYVEMANWCPINIGYLKTKIGVNNCITNDSNNQWAVANTTTLGYIDSTQGENSYEVPLLTILNFKGEIVVPLNPKTHPKWMENGRWNKLILNTPGGSTEVNLDMMYPREHHTRIQFSTMFDVISCTVNTKFTYDTKNTWTDTKGSPIYECSFNVGVDAMCIVTKYFNFAENLVKCELAGLAAAGGAFAGGMAIGATGGGAGLAKMSAATAMQKSGLNLKQNGVSIAQATMQKGIAETVTDIAPLAKVGAIGAAVSKLNPTINGAMPQVDKSTDRASFFNTVRLGLITLRMKVFRCNELKADSPSASSYPTPLDKYKHYCSKFGYPANKFITNLYVDGVQNVFYVFEDAHLNLDGLTTNELNGITDEEMNAIEQIAKSGFWYRI